MKLKLKKGTTSKTLKIFVGDSSSTTGAGLTGLVFNSASLTWYYIREGDAAATSVTPQTATLGTWTTRGFIAVGSMPGMYEIGVPDAALATGANSVHMQLRGATNMVDVLIEIELDAVDYQDSVRAGLTALPNAAAGASGGLPLSVDASGRVDVLKINGTSQTARDIGNSVLVSSGTGTGQLDFTSGVVKANTVQLLGTAWLTPGTAGTPDVNVKLWNGLTTVALPLVPTTAGRTLDVSTGGEAGIDWGNIGSPTTTVVLSGTTVGALTTYTGNTPQTGDAYARIGATGSGLTSLAPASTALSTATWTGTKAGYLDGSILSRMATFTLPTNFSTLVITGDGYVEADLATIGSLPVFASGSSVTFPEIVSGLTSANVATELATFIGTAGANLTELAQAGTALSNATWTDTKAGYLDAAISGISGGGGSGPDAATIAAAVQTQLGSDFAAVNGNIDDVETLINVSQAALLDVLDTVAKTAEFPANFGSLIIYDTSGSVLVTLPDPAPAGYGGTAPTAAQVADAVWDEILAGHVVTGSAGAALSASGSAADPFLNEPGDYPDGTLGQLISKLDVGEPEETVIVIPAPAADTAVCRVYGYMETIENKPAANVLITFRLSPDTAAGARSDKMLVNRSVSVRTDADGRIVNSLGAFYVELQRNDELDTVGTLYLVSCPELWDGTRNLTLTTDLFDLKGIA